MILEAAAWSFAVGPHLLLLAFGRHPHLDLYILQV